MIRKLLALGLLGGLVAALGCGSKNAKVEGIVTLDGKAVEGATVTFNPEEPKGETPTGNTDASGNFTLMTRGKAIAPYGNYKVTVIKVPGISGVDPSKMTPGSDEYLKAMKKGSGTTGGGPPGMPGMGGGGGKKSLLPDKYSAVDKTPLKVTIPPSERPVKIELSSK